MILPGGGGGGAGGVLRGYDRKAVRGEDRDVGE